MSRRGIVAGAVALSGAGAAAMALLAAPAAGLAKAMELEGDLIALCDRFVADGLLLLGDDLPEEELQALVERRLEARREISNFRARTPEGIQAKARVALAEIELAYGDRQPFRTSEFVAWSLCRDLLGRAGV